MKNLNQNNFNNISTKVALEMLKQTTANEMGVELGADTTARANGSVGGRVTQKLIQLGQIELQNMMKEQGVGNVELTEYLNSNGETNKNELH